ncbi:MAG: cobyric acid synthase [Nitrososphaeria archaeon]|nr:cobyric acid synthase [Conexivisphaerales archaeon]
MAVFGTSSGAGKTLLVSLLLKHFRKKGISAAPFKALNISLNAGVGRGGEIAFAQVFQAKIAGLEPEVDMNPVLVKPQENDLYVVIKGKHAATVTVDEFYSEDFQAYLRREIEDSFNRLSKKYELLVIEGTGAPTEINLPDLSNRYMLKISGAKYLLVSDIYRGGSLASILGTVNILGRERFIGAVLNRYSGREDLIRPAIKIMMERYSIRILGYIPYYEIVAPWEDSSDSVPSRYGRIKVLFVRTPYMSNFTDAFPLFMYPDTGINFQSFVSGGYDLIVFPGSKVTVKDIKYLESVNAKEESIEALKNGSMIMGICGGLQALSEKIIDNVESKVGEYRGLSLLKAKTLMNSSKVVASSRAKVINGPAKGTLIKGYEIHYGITEHRTPFELIYQRNDFRLIQKSGAYEGRVFGTYIHGIFENEAFTLRLLNHLRVKKGLKPLSPADVQPFEDIYEKIYNDFTTFVDVQTIEKELAL